MSDSWGRPKHFLHCPHCKKAVSTTEVGAVYDQDDEADVFSEKISLVSCDTCQSALLLRQHKATDGSWEDPERMWPGARRRLSWSIPEALRQEYDEAARCLESNAYTAAVVMVRRTLEGVAALHDVAERNLMQALARMQANGTLDPRLFEWSQALRVLGNEGAHFTGKKVSREDAADALALAEAILDYLYVLTAKFNSFMKRRTEQAEEEA